MAQWMKDGSFVYDAEDERNAKDILNDPNRFGESIKTTGGPNYDERVRHSENQAHINEYGEIIRPTGREYADAPSARDILASQEFERNNPNFKTTGAPDYDTRVSDMERIVAEQRRSEMPRSTGRQYAEARSARDILNDPNRFGEPIKTTGREYADAPSARDILAAKEYERNHPNFKTTGGPNYDERVNASEMMVAQSRERDRDKKEILATLIQKLPDNYVDLNNALQSIDYRNDLVKVLMDSYGEKVKTTAGMYQKDYSDEASLYVNSIVYAYLCLIETLKRNDVNIKQTDVILYEIMDMMQKRRRNGADVQIGLPIDYNPENPKVDGVSATFCVAEHIRGNKNMNLLWMKMCPASEEVFSTQRR